jgi:predicted deacetylase
VDGEHVFISLVLDLEASSFEDSGGRSVIVKPAQYLLRFDDLCPTFSRARWQRFVPLIEEFEVHPILAVVPENRDPELELSPPDPNFWHEMRATEARGAAIALHGYRHLCRSNGRSLVPLHRCTEFAGVPEETQRHWISAGLAILRGHGLNPRVWVAPRHGFDSGTLRALRTEGIEVASDGFARAPFIRNGLTWIPQQLWTPVEKSKGLWTICVHSNTADDSLVEELQEFVRKHATQFTSVERVLAEFQTTGMTLTEGLYELWALKRIQASRLRTRGM